MSATSHASSTRPESSPIDSPRVAAEILAGAGLNFADAAKLLPRRGRRNVAPTTVWRWARQGVKRAGGARVYLEVCRVGCRWWTSKPALQRFLAGNTAPTADATIPTAEAVNDRRKCEIAQAQAELQAIGI